MRKTLLTVIAALAATGAAAPAMAGTVTIEVSAAGLDLADDTHVAMLEQRIEAAARRACRSGAGGSIFAMNASRDCFEELVEKADLRVAEMRSAAIEARLADELAVID